MAELRNCDNPQTEQNACNIPVRELIHEWERMATAPKCGRPIIIAVAGKRPEVTGFTWHELPYPVCWRGGRCVYQRNGAPLFEWHRPTRWRPA